MKDLASIRAIIDDCDKQLVEIFERRMRAVLDVAEYKRGEGLPIYQGEREGEVIERARSYLAEERFKDEIEVLYREIMALSRKLQSRLLYPFNIVLIGFMASGKSSVARDLSKLLEMEAIDTDDLIIAREKMSIDEIFSRHGEVKFRQMERETVEGLGDRENTIISCGGGLVLDPQNVNILKNKGRLIWLKASPEEIYNRLLGDSTRPLLRDNLSLGTISSLLNTRLPLYEAASDIIIDTDRKKLRDISLEIIKAL